MPKRGSTGENSKKAAGQARKAEAAAVKKAVKDREAESRETESWRDGARDTSKKEAAAEKAAEAARRKAERAALEAEEMAGLKSGKGTPGGGAGKARGSGTGKKAATATTPKRGGLDLAQLDDDGGAPASPRSERSDPLSASATLNASGIDNALDALSLATGGAASEAIERHPERRFRAAYAAFEARRLEEMREDRSLRRQQKVDLVRKEFEKSPENPFNQVSARFNATKGELAEIRGQQMDRIEARLGSPTSPTGSGA